MSDAGSHEQVQGNLEAYLAERRIWINDAVRVLGYEAGTDPETVFTPPTEVRHDAPMPDLNSDQEASLREIAGRFGIGGEIDLPSQADHQIIDGGKIWKIEAEVQIAQGNLIFSAAPHRVLGEDEISYAASKFGIDLGGKTEYDVARFVAERLEDFEPLDDDEVLPFGYDVARDFEVVHEPTGQFVKIGTCKGKDVIMMRVDRNVYEEDGKTKKVQPRPLDRMVILDKILRSSGDTDTPVAVVTSNTYASDAIDAKHAELKTGRIFDAAMYGRATLAEVQGKPVPEPAEIQQIPGELLVMHRKLQRLEAAV